MMKRIRMITLLAALAMITGLFATVGSAQEIPPHGHMLVLGIEFEGGEPVSYRKCVDLANNKTLPLHVHHEKVHFGRAGEALFNAGHVVVPTEPFSDIRDCAHLAELFGPPTK